MTGERRRSAARDQGIIHTARFYRESAALLRYPWRINRPGSQPIFFERMTVTVLPSAASMG